MKKRTVALLLVFLLPLLLLSCKAESPTGLPFPQYYPFTQSGTLQSDFGVCSFLLCLTECGKGTLTLTSPEELAGVSFGTDGEEFTVCADGLSLPVSVGFLPEKGLLFKAFSLPEDSILRKSFANHEGNRQTILTYVGEKQNFIYLFDSSGNLSEIRFEGEENFVCSFDATH